VDGLEGMADVAVAVSQIERAVRLIAAAQVQRELLGKSVPPPGRAAHNQTQAMARATLGEERFATAWEEGQSWGPKEAVNDALACQPSAFEMASVPGPASARRQQERTCTAVDLAHEHGLTLREIEVLRLVAAGKSNSEIAETLVVSIRTAERHLANIYAKLETGGSVARAVATAYAHTHGLGQVTDG
jgi:DNA-binding CsgD family transcriptional regulator